MEEDFVVFRNYIAVVPADMAKMLLEGSGIHAIIRRGDGGGWIPYIGSAVQLLVRKNDVTRAEELIRQTEEKKSKDTGEDKK